MTTTIRSVPNTEQIQNDQRQLVTREWLVTNGLGGYASGTLAGINTRRYHGLLISALPAPFGRTMMLNHLDETITTGDGASTRLNGEERVSCALQMHGNCFLTEFRLEKGLPVWAYKIGDIILEKRIFMRYRQNTVQVSYKVLAGEAKITLELRPNIHFRPHQADVDSVLKSPYILTVAPQYYELSTPGGLPGLKILFDEPKHTFTVSGTRVEGTIYRVEESYVYPSRGALWEPGAFRVELQGGQEFICIASTHSLETIQAMTPDEAARSENERRELLLGSAHADLREGPAAELVFAADQFVISPAGRIQDTARIRATGGEIRTVIAGYHWFTDWGRDTMISLEGLTLLTGRYLEARWIIHTFAHYIKDGLIPNMFPEGEREGIYNTADATLWFFHALDRYLEHTGDRTTLRLLLPRLLNIVDAHVKGTVFGIKVDPADGLVTQGQQGYALTWMDARVGDWVVTPRRGKAVEINALWYNALRLLERWVTEEAGEKEAQPLAEHAKRAEESFNRRFWYAEGNYLFDVIDGEKGNDSSCRPNQIMSFSLHYPVLQRPLWGPVLKVVTEKLLTPVGLRSLSPNDSNFKNKHFGDIRARDAAYHQGVVWAWLIGPYLDAWLKVHPTEKEQGRQLLTGLITHLGEADIGSISEIFDAEPPYTPRGCVAQAWSVAEVLRCWLKTANPPKNEENAS